VCSLNTVLCRNLQFEPVHKIRKCRTPPPPFIKFDLTLSIFVIQLSNFAITFLFPKHSCSKNFRIFWDSCLTWCCIQYLMILYRMTQRGHLDSFHVKSSNGMLLMLVDHLRKYSNFYHSCVREKEKLLQNLKVLSKKLSMWGQICWRGSVDICNSLSFLYRIQGWISLKLYGTELKFGGFLYL